MGLEGAEECTSDNNREKLEEAGYIVVNNNEVYNANYESVKATLEAIRLKVTANAGETAGEDETVGNIYESNYPNQLKFSSDYVGAALRVLSKGDQVIVTYYK
ncbi:hypothetical protein [uncultured Enterococcus sp.]|uniref:hypothetical protein n=1 Tax=uncultured Enterococcus sp. TaxID=167972 RepID=UPI002AA75E32|nr:hypothetical protein [uncultured Enterococcus sp.]